MDSNYWLDVEGVIITLTWNGYKLRQGLLFCGGTEPDLLYHRVLRDCYRLTGLYCGCGSDTIMDEPS